MIVAVLPLRVPNKRAVRQVISTAQKERNAPSRHAVRRQIVNAPVTSDRVLRVAHALRAVVLARPATKSQLVVRLVRPAVVAPALPVALLVVAMAVTQAAVIRAEVTEAVVAVEVLPAEATLGEDAVAEEEVTADKNKENTRTHACSSFIYSLRV